MPIVRRKPDAGVIGITSAPLTVPVPLPPPESTGSRMVLGTTGVSRASGRSAPAGGRSALLEIEQRLHGRIISELRDSVDLSDVEALTAQIERLFNRFMAEEDVVLSRAERGKVFDQV